MTILFFLIALSILIVIHEAGHFILAKRHGVTVEEFSLGFGPRIIGIRKGGTDYRISGLPLGGYVKMVGEDPQDERSSDPGSFSGKGVWQRAKIILFGPLMNFIFCLLIMPVVFFIGRTEPAFLSEKPVVIAVRDGSPAAGAQILAGDRVTAIDRTTVSDWSQILNKLMLAAPGKRITVGIERNNKTFDREIQLAQAPDMKGGYLGIEPMLFLGNEAVVDDLDPSGPAAAAGIKKGDKITAVNNKKVLDFTDLSDKIDAGLAALIEIERNGEKSVKTVKPVFDNKSGRFRIGIARDRFSGVPLKTVRYGALQSIVMGVKETAKLASLTVEVLKKLLTFDISLKVLGGPVLIAKVSAAAAASGISSFLYFLAFLSLQLSIINCLPIPVLDGGHLLFLGIEAVRGRAVSARFRQISSQAGFFILMALMLVVTWNDLENIFGLKALISKLF